MTAPSPARLRRGRPEADIQRQIVALLRAVLPKGAIVHHAANEVGGGRHARARQAILAGMGVHAGFSDLVVLSEGRALFLEVKSARGRLSPAQTGFRDGVQAQGFAWALVRSPEDALSALGTHGFRTRLAGPRRPR
ncbi:VRR-NUC domain-containing protein [Paracoccus methylovorus]|uniref:VRR-NUC domain-containing protein n=1 Tax=Paracoccus methylovorus TaxID=2812658 RepID=A0ABX7JNP2_9RHOB|nr:VRR-NUC domain-containing protein [Paracoccus methylovorus]QRZ15575.1 VRR-NUC domain-containing protein [Paracoccus methylovorus]